MSDDNGVTDDVLNQLPIVEDVATLTNWLGDLNNQGQVVRTQLKASGRVIARVTDGIYRQPASALRELISNAWDADAENVTVLTDAPRFSRIYVRDDGAGMSYQTLSRLVHSIGGSAKRREEGQQLGVSSASDPDRTPAGRQIIGKIGIGLFSVSQLARSFRIVTKVRGERYRLVADVMLRAFSEDIAGDEDKDDDDTYVSGDVFIIREPTKDTEAHGTDIIIEDVKPLARDILRSASRWQMLEQKRQALRENDLDTLATIKVEEPKYHIGWLGTQPSSQHADVLDIPEKLPWSDGDPAAIRMGRMMDAVEREFSQRERPDLASTLDNYLEMLWTLSLSVPVCYVDQHPFDLTNASNIRLFWLSNEARAQATEVTIADGQTVRQAVNAQVAARPILEDGLNPAAQFRVTIDEFELKRPIRFKFFGTSSRGLDRPMLFVGRYTPRLGSIDANQRGGNLSLEGYLFWNGRIIPKENNGVLVRIRGASGSLFDPTFFKYQVSEQTRLRQITSELFIQKGVDAALNIDRESFNYSHPHVVLVSAWLHRAIRQLTNKHKEVSQRVLDARRDRDISANRTALTAYVEDIWASQHGTEPIPDVSIVETIADAESARQDGAIALVRSNLPALSADIPRASRFERDGRAQALVRVLAAYGIIKDMSYDEQQKLVEAILQVFITEARG